MLAGSEIARCEGGLHYHNTEGGETLAQVAQRGSGGPIPRNVRGYVGQDSEQHGVVE